MGLIITKHIFDLAIDALARFFVSHTRSYGSFLLQRAKLGLHFLDSWRNAPEPADHF